MRDHDVLAIIDELQDNIFNDKLTAIPDMFAALSIGLASIHQLLPSRQELNFKQILTTLVQAYTNKDYLLLADTLEYELKPLLTISLNGDGQNEANQG